MSYERLQALLEPMDQLSTAGKALDELIVAASVLGLEPLARRLDAVRVLVRQARVTVANHAQGG